VIELPTKAVPALGAGKRNCRNPEQALLLLAKLLRFALGVCPPSQERTRLAMDNELFRQTRRCEQARCNSRLIKTSIDSENILPRPPVTEFSHRPELSQSVTGPILACHLVMNSIGKPAAISS
jgi:hypothetical protein